MDEEKDFGLHLNQPEFSKNEREKNKAIDRRLCHTESSNQALSTARELRPQKLGCHLCVRRVRTGITSANARSLLSRPKKTLIYMMNDEEELSPTQKLLKSTISMLRAILAPNAKLGIPLHILPKEYEELAFEPLKYQQMGYQTIEQFLKDIPEVCTVSRAPEGYFVVKGIASKEDQHIYKLVAGQKKDSKKRKKKKTLRLTVNQVKRRGASRIISQGRKPNFMNTFSPSARFPSYSNNNSARGFSNRGRGGYPIRGGRSTAPSYNSRGTYNNTQPARQTFFANSFDSRGSVEPRQNNQQQSRSFHSASNSSVLPKKYVPPPRFQRQQQLQQINSSMKRDVIVLSSDDEKPVPKQTQSSTKLSQKELSLLESRLIKLLLKRPNGLWATRIRADYKDMFQEELHEDIRQLIKQHFSHIIRVESPVPNREILYLIQNEAPPKPITASSTPAAPERSSGPDKLPYLQVTAIFSPKNENVTRNVQQGIQSPQTPKMPITPITPQLKSPSLKTNGSILSPSRQFYTIENIEIPEPGMKVEAFICHVESLDRFFIQLADSPIDDLVYKMQRFYESASEEFNLAQPRIGEYCCARYSGDKSFFRAKILSIKDQSNLVSQSFRCRVMYVDYGNDETVLSGELKCLTEEYCKLPMQAIQCSLFDVKPLDEGNVYPDSTIQLFKEITQDVKLTVIVHEKNGNVLSVDLLDEQTDSVSNHLVTSGKIRRSIATRPSSRSSSCSSESDSKTSSSLWKNLTIESNEIVVCWAEFTGDDEYFDVMVSNINSTKEVYVVRIGPEHHEKLEQLEKHIDRYYDDEAIPPSPQLETGKYYAVYYTDSWYRAKLVSLDDNDCHVFLVDHGNKTIVGKEDMKDLLPKYYCIPFQAIHCVLSEVPESYEPEILQYFTETVLEKSSIAYIKERCEGEELVYSIEIYDSSSDTDYTNMNDELKMRIDAEQHLQPTLPEPGSGHCEAFITDITTTGEFFIQIAGPGLDQLQSIMKDMNAHFSKEKGTSQDVDVKNQQRRASEILSRPEVGAMCCAKFDHDGGWYRAEIKEVMAQQRKVKVEFIDYGNETSIPMLLARKPTAVSEKVVMLPRQAVKCRVSGLDTCSGEESEKYKEFVNNYVEYCHVELLRHQDNLPLVKIYIPEDQKRTDFFEKYKQIVDTENEAVSKAYQDLYNGDLNELTLNNTGALSSTAANNTTFENISVLHSNTVLNGHNSTLSEWDVISSETSPDKNETAEDVEVQNIKAKKNLSNITEEKSASSSGVSSEKSGSDLSSRSESPCTTYSPAWGIPDMTISEKIIAGVVQDTTDPYKFSFIPLSHWPQLEEMHTDMLRSYTNSQYSSMAVPAVGDVCAVYHKDHEIWYRAVIQAKVESEESLVVKFPDFSGTLEVVSIDSIRPLQDCFKKLPFLAIRCTLAGVEPLDGSRHWSSKAISTFYDFVMNESFQVETVCDRKDKSKPLEVNLHGATAKGERFVVNDQLVSLGLARKKKL